MGGLGTTSLSAVLGKPMRHRSEGAERHRGKRAPLGKTQLPACTEKSRLTNRPEASPNRRASSCFIHLVFQDTSSKGCWSLNNPETAGGTHSAFVTGDKIGTKEKE